jgi:hypothetical protein
MVRRSACIAVALAACWTSSSAPPQPAPRPTKPPVSEPPVLIQIHATLRIEPTSTSPTGGKKFQGVSLEVEPGKRFVIDYRARELWRSFEDSEVIVRGSCYEPEGEAVMAPHFYVHDMKFARPPTKSVPLLAIGPEQRMTGELVAQPYPPGSKLAGSTHLDFRSDAGATYAIVRGPDVPSAPAPGPAVIEARLVEVNLAYTATSGGSEQLWIVDVNPSDEPRERRWSTCK